MLKFGFDQLGNPAPRLYTRFVNAMIMFVVPATGTYIAAIPVEILSDIKKLFIGLTVTYVVALLKGLEYFLGDSTITEQTK